MSSRRIPPARTVLLLAALTAGACQGKKAEVAALPLGEVTRGDIAVRVQSTGTVAPLDTVAVKSKASGEVLQMPTSVGSVVKEGDLLAQIDPRPLKNSYDETVADSVTALANLDMARADKMRTDSLFRRGVVTASQRDSANSTLVSMQSNLITARTNLDIARQALEDATVRSPINATVISQPLTAGQIITSATSPSGGTTLLTIANLARVQMQVTVDEVEMGNVRVGETATVGVDAYPNHDFSGVIQKIEPQATVLQGVTFFPLRITIDNKEGLLLPGMSGEVTIKAADLSNVVRVPIDAIRPTTELAPISRMFDIPVDSLVSSLRVDLVSTEGNSGIPGRYVVVQLPNGNFEMRLVKIGPSDLNVAEVLSGVQPGDKVVMLGAIMLDRPTSAPILQFASDLRRGAPSAQAAMAKQAGGTSGAVAAPPAAGAKPAPPAAGAKPAPPGKASRP
jgi:HlyD family secretion protein